MVLHVVALASPRCRLHRTLSLPCRCHLHILALPCTPSLPRCSAAAAAVAVASTSTPSQACPPCPGVTWRSHACPLRPSVPPSPPRSPCPHRLLHPQCAHACVLTSALFMYGTCCRPPFFSSSDYLFLILPHALCARATTPTTLSPSLCPSLWPCLRPRLNTFTPLPWLPTATLPRIAVSIAPSPCCATVTPHHCAAIAPLLPCRRHPLPALPAPLCHRRLHVHKLKRRESE